MTLAHSKRYAGNQEMVSVNNLLFTSVLICLLS